MLKNAIERPEEDNHRMHLFPEEYSGGQTPKKLRPSLYYLHFQIVDEVAANPMRVQ
jgi:hypothetical protein